MSHSAVDRNGDGVWNPTPKQRRALLGTLTSDDAEACVSLIHNGQWTITAYHSGLVCFENAGAGEGPWHMTDIPITEILELWQLLSDGNIQELRKRPWQDGNGI